MLELLLHRLLLQLHRRLALACSALTLVDLVIRQDVWQYNNVSVTYGWVSETSGRSLPEHCLIATVVH